MDVVAFFRSSILPVILFITCLNVLFLGVRMTPWVGGFRESERNSKDGLPRDFVQFMGALFHADGDYNTALVRWIQLVTYTISAITVLAIVGKCSTADGYGCVNAAVYDFPFGKRNAAEGARHLWRQSSAGACSRVCGKKEACPPPKPCPPCESASATLKKRQADLDAAKIVVERAAAAQQAAKAKQVAEAKANLEAAQGEKSMLNPMNWFGVGNSGK